jgi:hypothetical protein
MSLVPLEWKVAAAAAATLVLFSSFSRDFLALRLR